MKVHAMRFQFEDSRAIAAGRYLRAADFPVIDPTITLASYDGLIRLALDRMPFLSLAEEEAVRAMLRQVLEYMMCLPASSTHHHRTAGGLFYHSLETATLAAESVGADHSTQKTTEAARLTAFVAGLLHDFGKVVATFRVHPQMMDIQDIGFGQIEEPIPTLKAGTPLPAVSGPGVGNRASATLPCITDATQTSAMKPH